MNLDEYFMKVAVETANNSKYPGTHVGCVLVNKENRIVTTGWNGYAEGAEDDFLNTLTRDERLPFTIHAEKNAIINAGRIGGLIYGGKAYITHYPCTMCASELVNAGVTNVTYLEQECVHFQKNWINPLLEKVLPTLKLRKYRFGV